MKSIGTEFSLYGGFVYPPSLSGCRIVPEQLAAPEDPGGQTSRRLGADLDRIRGLSFLKPRGSPLQAWTLIGHSPISGGGVAAVASEVQ